MLFVEIGEVLQVLAIVVGGSFFGDEAERCGQSLTDLRVLQPLRLRANAVEQHLGVCGRLATVSLR